MTDSCANNEIYNMSGLGVFATKCLIVSKPCCVTQKYFVSS